MKPIGINIELNVEAQDAYYGKAVFGQSDWLDSIMGITDYGHRGVPNVLLTAPLKSDGTWNSAHFKNKDYDSPGRPIHRLALDLGSPAGSRGQDPDASCWTRRRHLRLFLQLPDPGEEESPGHPQRAEPPVPLPGAFHLGLPRSIAGGSAAGDFFLPLDEDPPFQKSRCLAMIAGPCKGRR